MSSSVDEQVVPSDAVALTAEALLREHLDALVCGLAGDGLIVQIPPTVGLWGQAAIEGRALIDSIITKDRKTVIDTWWRALRVGVGEGKVRMLSKPTRWMTLYFLDVRPTHGILLGIVFPSEEAGEDGVEDDDGAPATPRFSTLLEDESGKVLDCDEAFTHMFGYAAEELIAKSALDHIHPDDQGRVVEGWLTMLSTRRLQQFRCRRKRKDGSFMWTDTALHNFLNQPDRNHVLIEIIDVSAEMAAQEALQEQGELLRRLIEAIPDGLLQLDMKGDVVFHNARLLEILGGGNDAAAEQALADTDEREVGAQPSPATGLLSGLTEQGMTTFQTALGHVLDESVDQEVEVDIAQASGALRQLLMSIRVLQRASGEVSGAITSVRDVTDSARARRELEKRAERDGLTRCHNRASIIDRLRLELEREDSAGTGVVYLDLDKFKSVNDTLGHAAGDEVLVLVAERLKGAIRDTGALGRLGGDEFLVLLPDISGPEIAMTVAQRIAKVAGGSYELSSGVLDMCASVGVACVSGQTITAEQLIESADEAMYRSKAQRLGLPVLATGPRCSVSPRGREPERGAGIHRS